MHPKLIIFDFDGTLADTTATILTTYRMTIEELGTAPRTDAECQATIGIPLREGFRQLYPDFSDKELDKCVDTYRIIFNKNKHTLVPVLYPGVKETLAKLRDMGIEMSVASSRTSTSLKEFCDEKGISGYFSLLLGAEDVTRAKPDPEPVLMTISRLKREAADALVVGDMPVDIAMGRGAGCLTVGVTYGNSTRQDLSEAGATYIVDSFPEILALI